MLVTFFIIFSILIAYSTYYNITVEDKSGVIVQVKKQNWCVWRGVFTTPIRQFKSVYNTPMLHFGPYITFQPCVRQGRLYVRFWPTVRRVLALWPCPQMTPSWPGPKLIFLRSSYLTLAYWCHMAILVAKNACGESPIMTPNHYLNNSNLKSIRPRKRSV